jgi:hypothetical protein
MTNKTTAKKTTKKRIIIIFLIFLLFIFFLVPQVIIRYIVNQNFTEGFWSSINTDKSAISPLLDNLTFNNVRLISRDDSESFLTIAEITITNINRQKLFKAIVGLEDWSFISEGQITLRAVSSKGQLGQLDEAKADTVYVENFVISADSPEQNKLSLATFKAAGVTLAWSNTSKVELDSLALFNLKDLELGGLMIGGLTIKSGENFDLDLQHVAASGLKISNIIATLQDPDPLTSALTCLASFESLDLSSLSVGLDGYETFHIQKALVDNISPNLASNQRLWSINSLSLDLAQLFPENVPLDPIGRSVLNGLGHKPTLDLDLKIESAGDDDTKATLDLVVQNSLEANILFNISGKNLGNAKLINQLMLAAPTINIGPGHISLNSQTFGEKFLAALETNLYNGNDAKQALNSSLEGFLASLEDPKDPQALNQGILAIELTDLVFNPKSLIVRWSPIRGFPQSILEGSDVSFFQATTTLAQGNGAILAEKFKYDILKKLNLSLEVNGRAPVVVYLTPQG